MSKKGQQLEHAVDLLASWVHLMDCEDQAMAEALAPQLLSSTKSFLLTQPERRVETRRVKPTEPPS